MVPEHKKLATRIAVLSSMLILAVLLSGCNVTLSPNITSLETIKVIPQDMGFYFSPEFRSYEFRYEGYKTSGDSGDKEIFAIGEASVDLFRQLLRGMFKSAVEVHKRPPPFSSGAALAGVIEPNIEEFKLSSYQEQSRREKRYRVRLTYRFTLYAPDGKIGVFWLSGHGSSMGRRFATKSKIYSEATDQAIKNAAKRFATDFQEIPEIQRWLDALGDISQK